MTTKQIEATQKILAGMNCATDVVYYCCPRGFNNETELLPIPTAFRAEAEAIVANFDVEGGRVAMLLPVTDLLKGQMLRLWGWDNEGRAAELLMDEWAMRT